MLNNRLKAVTKDLKTLKNKDWMTGQAVKGRKARRNRYLDEQYPLEGSVNAARSGSRKKSSQKNRSKNQRLLKSMVEMDPYCSLLDQRRKSLVKE